MNKKYTFTEDSKKFILLVSVNTPITTQDDHKKSILESPITLKQESIIDEIWYMQSRIYGSNNPVTTKEIIEI